MIIIKNQKELSKLYQDDRFLRGAERCGAQYQGNEQVLGIYSGSQGIVPVAMSHEFYKAQQKKEEGWRNHRDNEWSKLKNYLAQEKP